MMTDAPTTPREQELLEEFKAGLDPNDAPQLATRIAQLEAHADRASDAAGTAQKERDDMAGELDQLRAGMAEMDLPAAGDGESVAAAALRSMKALADRADKAEKATKAAKAKITRGDAPAKPRTLKPMDDGLSGDALSEALDDAIANDRKVEIAFSDGKKELTEIPPVNVEGMVWRDHALGKMLRDPVTIEGAGKTVLGIHGHALLIDGKQVAYQTRSDQLNVAPGQKITLENDIVF